MQSQNDICSVVKVRAGWRTEPPVPVRGPCSSMSRVMESERIVLSVWPYDVVFCIKRTELKVY